MEKTTTRQEAATRLERLGLKKASDEVGKFDRMMFAYSEYRYVSEDAIDRFNVKLRKDTLREDKNAYEYKRLNFIPLDEYPEIPPESVLTELEKAQEKKCFDTFEVAKVEWIKEVKDPILFGRIEGCPDRFFIAQWDDDVKIEDLI